MRSFSKRFRIIFEINNDFSAGFAQIYSYYSMMKLLRKKTVNGNSIYYIKKTLAIYITLYSIDLLIFFYFTKKMLYLLNGPSRVIRGHVNEILDFFGFYFYNKYCDTEQRNARTYIKKRFHSNLENGKKKYFVY